MHNVASQQTTSNGLRLVDHIVTHARLAMHDKVAVDTWMMRSIRGSVV